MESCVHGHGKLTQDKTVISHGSHMLAKRTCKVTLDKSNAKEGVKDTKIQQAVKHVGNQLTNMGCQSQVGI
jgi:hypothetical protein